MRPSATASRRAAALGQSVVEFALVLPIMVVLLLGIVDLARIYTTMLSVESAAREAADFGTFGSQKWKNADVVAASPDGTEPSMRRRACVAASDLPDYEGPDDNCVNPLFDYQLSTDKGVTWVEYDDALGCGDAAKTPPCWLRVSLTYEFKLMVPFSFDVFGTHFGVPKSLTFTRSSIFPMTDLSLDT